MLNELKKGFVDRVDSTVELFKSSEISASECVDNCDQWLKVLRSTANGLTFFCAVDWNESTALIDSCTQYRNMQLADIEYPDALVIEIKPQLLDVVVDFEEYKIVGSYENNCYYLESQETKEEITLTRGELKKLVPNIYDVDETLMHLENMNYGCVFKEIGAENYISESQHDALDECDKADFERVVYKVVLSL